MGGGGAVLVGHDGGWMDDGWMGMELLLRRWNGVGGVVGVVGSR